MTSGLDRCSMKIYATAENSTSPVRVSTVFDFSGQWVVVDEANTGSYPCAPWQHFYVSLT